jgi:putative Mg2+ transporter-C (MgtC) family protein
MDPYLDQGLRLVVAAILGGLVGYDRERMNRAAGLRTNILVALGSAGFTLAASAMSGDPGSDASRIVTGVATGIGFLGAGSILRTKDGNVEGVTTAAGIWVVGTIGVACGAGAYVVGLMVTALTLFVLVVLGKWKSEENE